MSESKDDIPVFYLDEETKELFLRTRNMLDQILETFDILENKELVQAIEKGEKEYKNGQVVKLDDYRNGKRSL